MYGTLRKKLDIAHAKITIIFEDGSAIAAQIPKDEVMHMLASEGYHIPSRYVEVRQAEYLTQQELYDAMRLYEIGCSWDEIAEAFGVDVGDLKTLMSKKARRTYREEHKERGKKHLEERNKTIRRMEREGISRKEISNRLGISVATISRACSQREEGERNG